MPRASRGTFLRIASQLVEATAPTAERQSAIVAASRTKDVRRGFFVAAFEGCHSYYCVGNL